MQLSFQLLWKCSYQKCSFELVFIDFTCVLSSLPGGWGDLLWLGTLSVTLPLHCMWSYWEPCWCLLLWSGGGSGLNLLWLLGTVRCSCLLVPPPWSAGGSCLSFYGCCGMLSLGNIGIVSAWAHVGCKAEPDMLSWKGFIFTWLCVWEILNWLLLMQQWCLLVHFVLSWSWNVWVLTHRHHLHWLWSWNVWFLTHRHHLHWLWS